MNAWNVTNDYKSPNWERENAGTPYRRQGANMNTKAESKERRRKTRKVYRKTKVLRMWVLPVLFLVPLGMMWLEYSIGKLIGLEEVKIVYQEQVLDPWTLLLRELNTSWKQRKSLNLNSPSFLANISYTPRVQCPPGQRRMINVHNPMSHFVGFGRRLIPKIIHQQSKTRCLTMKIDQATTKWAFRRWSYYIHDENSRSRLLNRYCGGRMPECEFPLLCQIVSKCFYNITRPRHYYLKVELWKFLILWIFGGVYVDTDFLPTDLIQRTIDTYDDGLLLLDLDTQMLSTKLMAVSPRHPIMFFAVHQMLLSMLLKESLLVVDGNIPTNSLREKKISTKYENGISGSSILNQAFQMFREGYGIAEEEIFSPGIFHGVMNRTVHIIASGGLNAKIHLDGNDTDNAINTNKIDLITRLFESEEEKIVEFEKMGMVIDNEENEAWTEANDIVAPFCLNELFDLDGDAISF